MWKCVYSILCECGGCPTGKQEGSWEYEEGCGLLEGSSIVEPNDFFSENTKTACVANLIIQHSLHICPVWFPVIQN